MRILLDTTILVAAMVEAHPAHQRALPWLQQVHTGSHNGLVAAHTLAELYSVLTTLPVQPRVSPGIAHQMIEQNVLAAFEIVTLSDMDYKSVLNHLADLKLSGGIIYDALILFAAIKSDAEQVITPSAKDFRRIYPEYADHIIEP
jgi:predicted nucleic acid-binding protein